MALPKDMRLKGHRTFNYIHKNSIKYHGKLMTFKVAKSKNLTNWRTVINTGAESGQTVFHLHIHFLSGRKMNWPPG